MALIFRTVVQSARPYFSSANWNSVSVLLTCTVDGLSAAGRGSDLIFLFDLDLRCLADVDRFAVEEELLRAVSEVLPSLPEPRSGFVSASLAGTGGAAVCAGGACACG